MRVSRLIPPGMALGAAALVGLAATGCATNQAASASRPAAAPAATTSVSAAPTGLNAELLAAKDLPAGWSLDASATNPAMDSPCPLLNSSLWGGSVSQRAEADLNDGLAGPSLVEQIGAGDTAQINRAWQALVAGLPQCATYTHSGSSGGSTFTITKLPSFQAFGDSSYAFTLDIAITGGVKATGNIVATRKGGTICVIYLVGVSGVTPAVTQDVVTRAVGKF